MHTDPEVKDFWQLGAKENYLIDSAPPQSQGKEGSRSCCLRKKHTALSGKLELVSAEVWKKLLRGHSPAVTIC